MMSSISTTPARETENEQPKAGFAFGPELIGRQFALLSPEMIDMPSEYEGATCTIVRIEPYIDKIWFHTPDEKPGTIMPWVAYPPDFENGICRLLPAEA